MNVRCIENRNYHLTIGKEYEVRQDGNYYYLVNDDDKNARYHMNLFENIPPPITLESFNCTYENGRFKVSFRNATIINYQLNTTGTFGISCGIKRMSLIKTLAYTINNCDQIPQEFKAGVLATLLYKYAIGFGMYVFSTNTNCDEIGIITEAVEYFNENFDKRIGTHDAHNPNSGNPIRLYVCIIQTPR